MEFDCKSQHHKCKAMCCDNIQLSRDIWERNQHKVITKPDYILELNNDEIVPITKNKYCTFLKSDYQCNIYEDRPNICRNYGDESSPGMSCPYLKKNGEPRSRQHGRCLQRIVNKERNSFNSQLIDLKRSPRQ